MPEVTDAAGFWPEGDAPPAGRDGTSLAQAVELSLLVDLEACWENLRLTAGGDQAPGTNSRDLHSRQKAYEAFRARLAAYNRRYEPGHLPELLLNTPSRLGAWCRKMRDLYLRVEHDPKAHCPAHLLEKAHRRAERIGARLNREPVPHAAPAAGIRDAVEQLEVLARWCFDQKATASQDRPT